MIRLLVFSIAMLFVIPAFAQAPPTDQEIAEAKRTFCGADHRVGLGSIGNRPADAGQYKPEWRDECKLIDAEHEKRGLAAKTKQADDKSKLNSIIGRIAK